MKKYFPLILVGCVIACLLITSANAVSSEATEQWKTAMQLQSAGKCHSALVASEKAIGLDPRFGRPWNVKGCALHCLGRNQEALEAFEKAIALEPTLEIAQKNYNHVLLDIQNGAPLTTAPIVLPEVRNESIQYDGELNYVPVGEPTGCCALIQSGHAVFYTNNKTIAVTGVRVAGSRYVKTDGNVRIEIWDKNFTALYSDIIPYERIPFTDIKTDQECINKSLWVDIDLPDHEVTGDFYIVIFTDSYPVSIREHAIFIDYYTPSETETSYAVKRNPNRLDTTLVGELYKTSELDWMIRVLYKNPPAPIAPLSSTFISGTDIGTGPINSSQGTGKEPVQSGQSSVSTETVTTKSPIEAGLIVIGLIFGIIYRKKRN
jgi:tetratricopeptide (TPR) repeat protein